MGSAVGCLKRSKRNENPLLKDKVVLSVRSSRLDDGSATSALSLSQRVPNNFKTEFNWSRIQTIYLGCSSGLDDDLNLTVPMVRTVSTVFDVLERDVVASARKIQFCVSFLGGRFRERFAAGPAESERGFRYGDVDDEILAHAISYIKFHKMLLHTFESNVDEARKCLNLLAYGHSVMNVTQTDFRMFDIAVEKFLLKFNVVDDDYIKITVSYFNLITNYICNYIQQNNDNISVNKLISTDDTLNRRERSRQLRKWYRLIGKLRYETSPYIEEALDLDNEEDRQPSTSTKNNKLCPLSNIECIFRNNKK